LETPLVVSGLTLAAAMAVLGMRSLRRGPENVPDRHPAAIRLKESAATGCHSLMSGYDATTYGESIAGVYDDLYAGRPDTDAAVALLAELAGDGPVLELGIGTGRLALPLAARGLAVSGIDSSPAMVEVLRAKPGGGAIPVTIGDFADVEVGGRYRLVFVAFNTLFGLLTQDDQVRCFESVARVLDDDGVFVVEAFVPDLGRFRRDQNVSAVSVDVDAVQLDVSQHDPVQQRVDSSHVFLGDGQVRLHPVRLRYAWPSELDLMARLAGLRLRHRWAGWDRTPFIAASGSHVSAYGR
jgi:SAM-dependent methyltransferase